MKSTLYLIRGLPGSGKSYLANLVSRNVCEADDYFLDPRGNYKYDPSQIKSAHAACQDHCRRLLEQAKKYGNSVAVANTFTRQWELQPYREIALEMGALVIEISLKVDLNDRELASRNLHGVPEDVISKMRLRWEA